MKFCAYPPNITEAQSAVKCILYCIALPCISVLMHQCKKVQCKSAFSAGVQYLGSTPAEQASCICVCVFVYVFVSVFVPECSVVQRYSVFRVDSSGANRARAAAYVLSAGLDSQSPSFNFIVSVFVYLYLYFYLYFYLCLYMYL